VDRPLIAKAYLRKGQALTIKKDLSKALDVLRAGLAIEPENAELKAALQKVMWTINQQQATGNVDPERARRAMADPEIQAILQNPEVATVLQQARQDPNALSRYAYTRIGQFTH
jgi:stress-induced-phosphoprotein 1